MKSILILFLFSFNCYACEILMLARDDKPNEYGNIIDIKEDSYAWLKEELNIDKFFIIKCKELSVSEAKKAYMPITVEDKTTKSIVYSYIDEDYMAKENKDTLEKEGTIKFTKEGITQCSFQRNPVILEVVAVKPK